MSKFTDALTTTLTGFFDAGDQPTAAQFAQLILAIQEGIEEHDHDGTGDGDGITTLAGVLTLDLANSRIGVNQPNPEKEVHIAGAVRAEIAFEKLATAMNAYFAFQGNTMQLSMNRDIAGVFSDAAKAAASINIVGAAASSYIDFYTKDANNVAPDLQVRIDKLGNVKVTSLAGVGVRAVVAAADGTLSAP